MRKEVVQANIVVFIASFCTLVIELVAGRILAPFVGVSLYTWTSIIGIVLAGISIGAYLGGLISDRYPRPSTLGWLLLPLGSRGIVHFSPDQSHRLFTIPNQPHGPHPPDHHIHLLRSLLFSGHDLACRRQADAQ